MRRSHPQGDKEPVGKRTRREGDTDTQDESDDRDDSHESGESWQAKFELLFGEGLLSDQYKDLSLPELLKAPKSALTPELLGFVDTAVISNITAYPVMVATPADLADAVNEAVNAAVGPAVNEAVNAAVGPAVTAAIAPLLAMQRNNSLRRINATVMATEQADLPLSALQKENQGIGPGLPGAALPGLPAAHPFPVGAIIPTPPFPATRQALEVITHADISNLSALYNDDFDIVAGDGLPERRNKLERWLTGV